MLEQYLKNGFSLIRLNENAKTPVSSWDKGESQDVLQQHNGNFGVLTGESGIVVVDVDTHGKEILEGYNSLASMCTDYEELPETFNVSTPTGGAHYYYKLPDYANGWVFDKQVKRYPSIDLQTGKTYVVSAGSTINGSKYQTVKGDIANLAVAPEWLLRVYKKVEKKYKSAKEMTHTGEFLHEIIQGAGEGSRNVWMTQVCGKLFRSGIPFKEVKQWFYLINQIGCRPQLPKDEMETIYKSIERSEIRNRKQESEELKNV